MGNEEYQYALQTKQITDVYKIFSNQLINKKHLREDMRKIPKNIINQLFESFRKCKQYHWSNDIIKYFFDYFYDYLRNLWYNDKILFYEELLSDLQNTEKRTDSKFGQSYYIENSSNGNKQINKENEATKIQNKFYSKYLMRNSECDQQQKEERIQQTEKALHALNASIISEKDQSTFFNMNFGLRKQLQLHKNQQSAAKQKQIQRSSFIVSQTIFTSRLDREEKEKISDILNFYKKFSSTLQQILRSIRLISFPLKHFEISFKKKIQNKKIKPNNGNTLFLKNTKEAAIYRKKQQFNNNYILTQIKDFCDAYTQFIWKYLNLFRISQTCFANYITIDTTYGVVLKSVWNFTVWITQRGFQWQQMQIPNAIKTLNDKQKQLQSKQKKKRSKKILGKLDEESIKLGCELCQETNPQRYFKQIVIIYRQLSKKCTCADQLILYYEQLFEEIAKRDCYNRLFKMKLIIEKLLKIQDSCGQISYAWTTWNIMVENLKNTIEQYTKNSNKSIEEEKLSDYQIN